MTYKANLEIHLTELASEIVALGEQGVEHDSIEMLHLLLQLDATKLLLQEIHALPKLTKAANLSVKVTHMQKLASSIPFMTGTPVSLSKSRS